MNTPYQLHIPDLVAQSRQNHYDIIVLLAAHDLESNEGTDYCGVH